MKKRDRTDMMNRSVRKYMLYGNEEMINSMTQAQDLSNHYTLIVHSTYNKYTCTRMICIIKVVA